MVMSEFKYRMHFKVFDNMFVIMGQLFIRLFKVKIKFISLMEQPINWLLLFVNFKFQQLQLSHYDILLDYSLVVKILVLNFCYFQSNSLTHLLNYMNYFQQMKLLHLMITKHLQLNYSKNKILKNFPIQNFEYLLTNCSIKFLKSLLK